MSVSTTDSLKCDGVERTLWHQKKLSLNLGSFIPVCVNLGLFLNLFELQPHALSKIYIKRLLHYLVEGLS